MSDDERVQQVIDELDPTPAHEAAWPVSRRQTLRALAAAGLLGSVGSASAESAGRVIADEAFLSNYESESVSDGWELTIDDDVFALTESDTETIGLPDGGLGSELVTPSGVEAREFVGPDGSVVWQGDVIPDSGLLRRYQFNDDSDTTTATDSEGSNDGTINGATYTTDAIEGSHALDFDGTDDFVDIPNFSTFESYTVICWLFKDSFNAIEQAGYFQENNSIAFRTRETTTGDQAITNGIELAHDDGSTTVYTESDFDTGRWQMFAATWDGSTVRLYRDEGGSVIEKDSVSISGMGAAGRGTEIGRQANDATRHWTGRQDDYAIYNRALTQSELQDYYDAIV